jgi:transcriptional regulator with XRE-family HTH domain
MREIMSTSDFPERLRRWRKLNHIKQAALAADLCVSQAAISRWEHGLDVPSPAKLAALRTVMNELSDECVAERLYTERLGTPRAMMALDGMQLLGISRGLSLIWPEFSLLKGRRLEDYLVNEAASFFHRDEFTCHVRDGTPLVVTGVSDRHISLQIDTAFRHRWHACLRRINGRSILDITYEPCAPDTPVRIEDLVMVDSFTA